MQIPSYNYLVSFWNLYTNHFLFQASCYFWKFHASIFLLIPVICFWTQLTMLTSGNAAAKFWNLINVVKCFFWNLQCLFLLSVENLNSHILHVSDLKFSALDRSMNLTTCFFIILSDCIKRVHLKKIILIISIKNTFFSF